MDLLARVLLTIVYLLVLPVRFVRALLGHDRLRLRRPLNAASYWVMRENEPNSQSYFSETSWAEGCPGRLEVGGSLLRSRRRPLVHSGVAADSAPRCTAARVRVENKHTLRDRAAGIPDEVYTLW